MKPEQFSSAIPLSLPERPVPEPSAEKPYVYVLIRTDISFEQQLVQASHAALEAGFRFKAPDEVASVIVLSVPSRQALLDASARLKTKGIDHELFFEPDFDMGHSALATRPLSTKSERYLMRKYPLYRAQPPAQVLPARASTAQEMAHV